jgi:hypothetical protein
MLASPCMFSWGIFQRISSQKINKIKIKLAVVRLCVCLSWFKETGDFTMSEGHRYPLVLYIKATWCLSMWTKIGQCLEDSSSHCPFPVELVRSGWQNRIGEVITGAGQGRAVRAAVAGGQARCHFY